MQFTVEPDDIAGSAAAVAAAAGCLFPLDIVARLGVLTAALPGSDTARCQPELAERYAGWVAQLGSAAASLGDSLCTVADRYAATETTVARSPHSGAGERG